VPNALIFDDRHHAGQALARAVQARGPFEDPVVLGLARGGIPVAYEVARALRAPLDVFVVRKLGVPGREELAMGAIATGDVRVINVEIVDALGLSAEMLDEVAARELKTLDEREQSYRGTNARLPLAHKTAIVVDDGLATGASMKAAVVALRQRAPLRLVVAVPVAARETCAELEHLVDEMVCATTPVPFAAVGCWYRDFSETTDAEVQSLLAHARTWVELGATAAPSPAGGLVRSSR
jgi:predicted phosphoribosyltransferase